MPHLDTISVSESETESDFEAGLSWGCKILPKLKDEIRSTSSKPHGINRRYYSTECETKAEISSQDFCDFERRSMPCIFTKSISVEVKNNSGTNLSPQVETKRHRKLGLTRSHSTSSCSFESSNLSSDLSWIDRTPSESSLQLPFCPPVRVDFEDFSDAFNNSNSRPEQKPLPSSNLKPQQKTEPKVQPELVYKKAIMNSVTSVKYKGSISIDSDSEPIYCDLNFSTKMEPKLVTPTKTPERYRRSMQPPDRELTIIPIDNLENQSDFIRAIPSPVIPLQSSTSFISFHDVIYQSPPGFEDPEEETLPISDKKSHFVEIVIQISPPLAFSTPILSPPPLFSTTVTRPNFPKKATAISRNSQISKTTQNDYSSIRSSLRDSGLADISPHIGRRRHHHISSSQSFLNSTSPTSGMSSDEAGASMTGLATPTQNLLAQHYRQNYPCSKTCCFHSARSKGSQSTKCLPFNLVNKRRLLKRERSQSLDDSTLSYSMSARPNLDSDGAISCLDLPLSSLSTDIYEDEEDVEERDSSYRSALYAHWWLKAPFKKQTDL